MNMTNKVCILLIVLLLAFTPGVSALNVVDTVLQDVWDSTGQTIRISYVSSESGWDVAEETALTNTVHPLVTFTHTTSDTPAAGIGLSLDWYQETAAANTELAARIAVVASDVTATSEDFRFDWMLMAAGATPATKMSLGSTGILTLVGGATLDNATSATNLNITETTVTITGNQVITGSVDITGAGGLILSNDETITNAVDGTVLITATTLATSGALDVTGGGITLENDETITNAVNGAVVTDGTFQAPSFIVVDSTEGSGALTLHTTTASSGTLTGATDTIEVNIPANALLHSCQLRVDVAVTNDGDNTWSAAYSGGATQEIAAAATAAAKNTKVNTFFDAKAATAITSGETDITLTPQAADFTAGEITAVCYYYTLTALTDAP